MANLAVTCALISVTSLSLLTLSGCGGLDNNVFPNSPNGSFVYTPNIGPGPAEPVGPASRITYFNPTGQ